MKKIIVNEVGDFRIKLDDGRWCGKGRIYTNDDNLEGLINSNILSGLVSAEVIAYTPKELTDEEYINMKIRELENKRKGYFTALGAPFKAETLLLFVTLLTGTQEEVESRLPKTAENGVQINTYTQIQELIQAYDAHIDKYSDLLTQARTATTKAEIDAILEQE